MFAQTAVLAFAVLMLVAAWTDLAGYRIPNWIPAALLALWPVAAFLLGMSWVQIGFSLLTFVVVLAIGMALWAPGWIGGGDAKLIAAAALWFGWPDVVNFMVWFALAGGVLSLVLVVLRKAVPAFSPGAAWLARGPLADGAPAPYAVAIAAGALIALPGSRLVVMLAL